MIPVAYDPKEINEVILISENGTEYLGEYTDIRIDPKTIPEGKFMYQCRHGDEGDWATPITIEEKVIVNFAGTFITNKPIVFPDDVGGKCINIVSQNIISF